MAQAAEAVDRRKFGTDGAMILWQLLVQLLGFLLDRSFKQRNSIRLRSAHLRGRPPGCHELVHKSLQHKVAWACQRPKRGPQPHEPPRVGLGFSALGVTDDVAAGRLVGAPWCGKRRADRSLQFGAVLRRVASPPGEGGRMRQSAAAVRPCQCACALRPGRRSGRTAPGPPGWRRRRRP
jgi:hypothetical protein